MNIQNRTLFIADNLDIMRGIDSETIDLIYLDPPFNTNEEYKAPIGSPAEGAKFKDIWTDEDIREEWHGQIASKHEELYQIIKASETTYDKTMRIYLTAMAVRLFEMQRILKSTGSIYLHCDPTASHYLKLILDNLFDKDNFRSEIIWKRHSSHNDKVFGSIHDVIFYYSSQIIPISDDLRMPIDPTYTHGYNYSDEREEKYGKYASVVLTAPKQSAGEAGKTWKGIDPGNRQWSPPRTGEYAKYIEEHFIPNYTSVKSPHQRLDLLNETNLIHWSDNNNPRLKRYRNAYKGNLPQSIWTDIPPTLGKEKTGYPTQKPLKLLERIIKASDQGKLFSPIEMSDVIVSTTPPLRTDNAEEIAIQQKLPAYQTHKPELFGKQQGRCNGCGYEFHYRNLSVDHIKPKSKGIDNRIENLQLLCTSCNSKKEQGHKQN